MYYSSLVVCFRNGNKEKLKKLKMSPTQYFYEALIYGITVVGHPLKGWSYLYQVLCHIAPEDVKNLSEDGAKEYVGSLYFMCVVVNFFSMAGGQ